jgi:hypothetical protein
MEVQFLDKGKAEVLADWLLEPSLKLKKVNNANVQCLAKVPKSMCWDPSLRATHVHYYHTNKSDLYPSDFEQIQNDDDMDSCKSVDISNLSIVEKERYYRAVIS